MILRIIPSLWLREQDPTARVREGEFTEEQWKDLNVKGYNVYFLPNYPSKYTKGITVDGAQIDIFGYVFVDFDVKTGRYGGSKEVFVRHVQSLRIPPTSIVDTGGGVHAYWSVADLDVMSYLRLSRRLMRLLDTDEAVGQIYQLMRLPGSMNMKEKDNPRPCVALESNDNSYTCEQLDAALPSISHDDEAYCQQHYEKTYSIRSKIQVDDKLPVKFSQLMRENSEVKDIFSSNTSDRSRSDMRLGHLMWAAKFSKAEAMSVLVNCAKALERAPVHRVGYAESIVEKIWTEEEKSAECLSEPVDVIIKQAGKNIKGTRFKCHPAVDNTEHGFRLGQILGLVAGTGVGKTAFAMNMFRWYVEKNPEYNHVFVSLEQPKNEVAERWHTLCQGDNTLHHKVRILSNYNADGSNRNLSLDEIKDHILELQLQGNKIGTVVIDHVGVLRKQNRNGETQGLIEVFKTMKAFAIATNTMVIMQSQAPREKAGIGDLELNKDSAYGGVQFESFVDYLVTLWQPLKRVYSQGAPTVMAYKFCKIRHKRQDKDMIKEDVRYALYFDPATERLREMTQEDHKRLAFFNTKAVKLRKQDRKTEDIEYVSLKAERSLLDDADHDKDLAGSAEPTKLSH